MVYTWKYLKLFCIVVKYVFIVVIYSNVYNELRVNVMYVDYVYININILHMQLYSNLHKT